MTERQVRELYSPAVRSGDVATVEQLLQRYPEILCSKRLLNFTLEIAATVNQVAIMAVLVERGANINVHYTKTDRTGPICVAATNGSTAALRWLLERGARVSIKGDEDDPCPALTLAAMKGHLDCVRLLVEAGAPLGSSGELALFAAKQFHHQAVIDYLRVVGTPEVDAVEVDETDSEDALPASGLSPTATAGGLPDLRRHLELQLLGNLRPLGFHELLPSDPPISVLVLDQYSVRQAIVTEGMSSVAMDGPVPYAELVMYLPADWPLDASTTASDEYCWPVNWLRRLAHIPHEQGVGYQEIAHLDPGEALGPGTRLSTLLLLARDGERESYTRSDGERVVLFTVLAIYPEERDFARKAGLGALLKRLDERGLLEEVRPDRPSVAE